MHAPTVHRRRPGASAMAVACSVGNAHGSAGQGLLSLIVFIDDADRSVCESNLLSEVLWTPR
jgi:hypothetical protein